MNTTSVQLIDFFFFPEMVLWDKVEATGKLHILLTHGDPEEGFWRLLANCLKNLVDFLLTCKIQEAKPCFPYILDLNKQT